VRLIVACSRVALRIWLAVMKRQSKTGDKLWIHEPSGLPADALA